ncbi:MAG: tetratricopeptide repeat protein [Bryobacterales bacterium]|nr:tetratricopeptide repeat protein [Bryobacterales bacterium]
MYAPKTAAAIFLCVALASSCSRPKSGTGPVAQAAYADPRSCAACHPAQARTYRATGMARAFTRATPAAFNPSEAALFARATPFFHKASNRFYQPLLREGRAFLRRFERDSGGAETNAIEYEIHYILGSGNHSRTYLHRDPANHLVEMPLSWYSEAGGSFAMSPGFDNPAHYDFRRKVNYDCFFCHNGYPDLPSTAGRAGDEPVYPVMLPEGIDCQRCHGPGAAHVEAAGKKTAPEALRKLITNPARLNAARQMEVCMQCHLETTSFPLPNSIQRYGRGIFSYRPGEPLGDYILHFDHAPGTGREEKFEIAGHAYRLRQSQCFLKSVGRLRCTTCHNPHEARRGEAAVEQYAAACATCHEAALAKLTASGRHAKRTDCATCHMPRRRTEDVVHVVMTDHKIVRRPPPGNLLAPRAERLETAGVSYRGPVVPYYPATGMDELPLASAQVLQKSNLAAGIPQLEAALRKQQPKGPEYYFDLAEAQLAAGHRGAAIEQYEAALRHDPGFAPAVRGLGGALLAQNELARAVPLLEQARSLDPRDTPTLLALARAYQQQGRLTDSIATLRAAAVIEPTGASIQELLGNAFMASGEAAQAEAAFRTAILHQPDLATAHYGYSATLAARGDFDAALPHMERAVALAPQLPQPREMLGNLYARRKQFALAIPQYREAIRLDPQFGRAHLGLAIAAASTGDLRTARAELQQAAASPDPAISQDARELLGQLPQ